MNYATCIMTFPEGFGSKLQFILSCYLFCIKNNLQFVYTDIKNFEHMSWNDLESQDNWDLLLNNYIKDSFLLKDIYIEYKNLPKDINIIRNSYNIYERQNNLYEYTDEFIGKTHLDNNIHEYEYIFGKLSVNYLESTKSNPTYFKKDIINIALHIRRLTNTDVCNADIRELYIKGNKFDLYYCNCITNLKNILKDRNKEFHIYTQLNDSEDNTIFDHYYKLQDGNTKIIIHKGGNLLNDIHHMILSDIFIMSKSSLSAIVNYYRKGISIIREKFHHKLRINTIYNSSDGNFNEEQEKQISNYLNLVSNPFV